MGNRHKPAATFNVIGMNQATRGMARRGRTFMSVGDCGVAFAQRCVARQRNP